MNVTYLLGAGASANCLPVISNFESRLNAFKNHLQDHLFGKEFLLPNGFENLIEDVKWIIKESASHQTIDTLAKKFFHQSGDFGSLLRLKTVLIIFFTYEQSTNKVYFKRETMLGPAALGESNKNQPKESIDKRYDSFIASILKNQIGKIELSDNVKILTWNYDLQFELAFKNYVDDAIFHIQRKIQSIPNRGSINEENCIFNFEKFGLVRLNGSASVDYVEQEDNYETFLDFHSEIKDFDEYFKKLFELYSYISSNKKTTQVLKLFNYSWEANSEFDRKYKNYNQTIDIAKKIAKETEVLVVIGYSFPFFNREIDRSIIENLFDSCKIYIQDIEPVERIDHFKTSFADYLKASTITPIKSVSSFFLPPEL